MQVDHTSAAREIEQHIQVGDSFHGPVVGQGGVTIIGGREHNIILPQDTEKVLQSLPGWDLKRVRFDESKACFSGTRQQLLDDIRQWVQSPGRKRILWISGGAGTGKSSVAHSCAASLDKSGSLGASFFFNRDIPMLNSPDYLITNLCYQLAHFDHQSKNEILRAIQSMGYIPASYLRSQARKLIVETTTAARLEKPAVLVVDAVDEAGTTGMRESLLNSIAEEFSNLPDSVKVIVTSRDESDIRASLEECSDEFCIEHAEKTEDDIASYIQRRFTTIRKRSRLPQGWPRPDKLEALCLRAGRLFIWASVAWNFVDSGRDHNRRLNELLHLTSDQQATTPPLSTLNSLYNRILETVFPIQGDHPADYHYVVGSISVLEVPLTRIELDSLLGFGNDSDEDGLVLPNGQVVYLPSSGVIIDSLRSILREDSSGYRRRDGPIRLLHPSLYDFMTIHADEHLRINVIEQHQTLAIRCLQVMNSQLKFDIADIGDASLPNPDISEMSQFISAGLRYSCFSFVYHISKVLEPNAVLISASIEFVCEHILHWIEAMSLLREITKAEQRLQRLASWMRELASIDKRIEMVVRNAALLLRHFGQGVRLSSLHTYYSALALTPKSRELYKCWFGKIPGVPRITCSHPSWPTASVRVLEGHTGNVEHVVFSPDGKMLASASDDGTLRLWDVESGQPIADTLEGHTDTVSHVVFSPDGKKLASASYDDTLRLWDVESGQAIGDPLEGHRSFVNRVVFSPDGRKLASASNDETLRLWDVESGQPIGDPLEGHTSFVKHVVFSPDGKKLASASNEKTLRLWDVESSPPIGHALKGHTSWVNHVAFSPDGNKLASASNDKTLRLWDVESGQPIGDPLEGHTNWVNFVEFSPDGKKLASASDDHTLRLWDAESGQPIGDPLEGHTFLVKHVLFSPDGQQLVSASDDHTLRLWDVKSGQPIGDALKGHISSVTYVVFSPDGKKIASASNDKTVRLWDVESDQSIGGPFEGHTDCVNLIEFSPDGKKLASASDDHTLRLWDVESGQPVGPPLGGHTSLVKHVVFSPDGKKLASASYDNTLRFWDLESDQSIGHPLEGHTSSVKHLVFSPDGRKLASASYDETLRLWDVESGQPIGDALEGHTHMVNCVVFSPDAKILASASHDKTLRLWDVESAQPIGDALYGHTRWVKQVVFSPDGKKLASVSDDQTLLWDVESRQPIGDALEGHTNDTTHIVFSPDGTTLALSSRNNPLRLWDVEMGLFVNPALFPSHHCWPLLLTIDSQGYLRYSSKRLIWLPVALRGCIALSSSSVAIGSPTGAVTFIRWPVPLLSVGMHMQSCLSSPFQHLLSKLLERKPLIDTQSRSIHASLQAGLATRSELSHTRIATRARSYTQNIAYPSYPRTSVFLLWQCNDLCS